MYIHVHVHYNNAHFLIVMASVIEPLTKTKQNKRKKNTKKQNKTKQNKKKTAKPKRQKQEMPLLFNYTSH